LTRIRKLTPTGQSFRGSRSRASEAQATLQAASIP
jgi:hypothetical protein